MSNEMLSIFMQLIVTQLNNALDKIEEALPDDFRVKTGGSNIFIDPERVDYPVLGDLYHLRNDLTDGIEQLQKK